MGFFEEQREALKRCLAKGGAAPSMVASAAGAAGNESPTR